MADLTGQNFAEIFPKLLQDPGDGSVQKSDGTEGASGKVDVDSIVNDLTTGGTDVPLSAEQGKELNNDKANLAGGNKFEGDQDFDDVVTANYTAGKRSTIHRYLGNRSSSSPPCILLGSNTLPFELSGKISARTTLIANNRDTLLIDVVSKINDGDQKTMTCQVRSRHNISTPRFIQCTYEGETHYGILIDGSVANWYPERWFFSGTTSSSDDTFPLVVSKSELTNITDHTNTQSARTDYFENESVFHGDIKSSGDLLFSGERSLGTSTAHDLILKTNNTERGRYKTTGQLNFKPLSSDPSGAEGDVYFNSTSKKLRVHDGTTWVDLH